jgi:chemotaxis protein histidine kinase CheA
LLDNKFRISLEHSAALRDILDVEDPAQQYLPDVLQSMSADESTENIVDFLELMFRPAIEEETLTDLNPLTEVSVKIRKKTELVTKDKVLSFKFQRIFNDNEIIGLIATVVDISEKVRLARRLVESEEQAKLQMEWFMGILHVEPPLLKEFIDSANNELDQIETTFRTDQNELKLNEVLDGIYRSVHMIKGNASLLDLKFFANRAHAFEEKIEEVKKKETISAKDFIPLAMQLNEMRKNIGEITKMIERISRIHAHFRPKRNYENQLLLNSLKNLIKSLSQDLNKQVRFEHQDFDPDQLPYEYRLLVKDLMVQMVRNSMSHGIESMAERKKRKKPALGRIEIKNFFENGYYCFTYQDDGRGLQLKKLRETAENSGRWDKREIAGWNDRQLAELIYQPGFSTSRKADLRAGRGVGMDIIKKKIDSHRGKLLMNSDEGKFLEFTVKLPVKKTEAHVL